jgi:hypothetical protein
MQKATLIVGRIGFGILLVLLATGIVSLPARANSSAQSTGYWQYIKTNNILQNYPDDSSGGDVHKISISESGGSYHYETTFTKLNIYQDDCTWAITIPTGLDKLNPGDTGDVTITCTDTSQDEGGQAAVAYVSFSVGPPLDPSISVDYRVEPFSGIADEVEVLAQESKTNSSRWLVPDSRDDQMALIFYFEEVGISERIYKWVPGKTVAPSIGVSPVPPVTEPGLPVLPPPPAQDIGSGCRAANRSRPNTFCN